MICFEVIGVAKKALVCAALQKHLGIQSPKMTESKVMRRDRPVRVPELRRKLDALYNWAWKQRMDAGESGDAVLVGKLGITQPNIYAWISGSDTRHPNTVPGHQARKICESVFRIPPDVFEGDWEVFQRWLTTNKHRPPSTWAELADNGDVCDMLKLVRRNIPPGFLGDQMGLALPDEGDTVLERYKIGEQVSVEVNLQGIDWLSAIASDQGIGLVLLARDVEKTTCLCPSASKHSPPGVLRGTLRTRLPVTPDKWLQVTGPTGAQSVYAVVTQKPLPDDTARSLVAQAVTEQDLNGLAHRLMMNECGYCRVFKRVYIVM